MKLLKYLGTKQYSGSKRGYGLYECSYCGNTKEVLIQSVSGGMVKSCGCIARNGHDKIKHGMHKSRIYSCWRNLKTRCDGTANKKCRKNYSEKGIKYDDKWIKFEGFYEDMYEEYDRLEGDKNKLTIDRIDSNGNYTKENCRWLTRAEQMLNTSRTIVIEHPETKERKPLLTWSKEYGLNYHTCLNRHARGIKDFNLLFGELLHKSNTTRKDITKELILELRNSGLSVSKMSKQLNCDRSVIFRRLKKN